MCAGSAAESGSCGGKLSERSPLTLQDASARSVCGPRGSTYRCIYCHRQPPFGFTTGRSASLSVSTLSTLPPGYTSAPFIWKPAVAGVEIMTGDTTWENCIIAACRNGGAIGVPTSRQIEHEPLAPAGTWGEVLAEGIISGLI